MENFLSKQPKAKTNRIHPTKISSRLVGVARACPFVESEDVPGGPWRTPLGCPGCSDWRGVMELPTGTLQRDLA